MTVDTPTNQLPVTWIIGATGGIGSALARRLAPRTELVLSARNEAPLTVLASELAAQACTVDVTQQRVHSTSVNKSTPHPRPYRCSGACGGEYLTQKCPSYLT